MVLRVGLDLGVAEVESSDLNTRAAVHDGGEVRSAGDVDRELGEVQRRPGSCIEASEKETSGVPDGACGGLGVDPSGGDGEGVARGLGGRGDGARRDGERDDARVPQRLCGPCV